MLTYVLAVMAACANGLSFVRQRKANKQVPQRENLRPRLVWSLLLGGLLYLLAPSPGKQVHVHWYVWLAGSTFGLTAALMKAMTITLSRGFGELFTSWQIYAMVAAGVLGTFLTQSAMNAGRLIATQPGLTLSDPLISVLWGVAIFNERVRLGWYVLGEVFCAGNRGRCDRAGALSALVGSRLTEGARR